MKFHLIHIIILAIIIKIVIAQNLDQLRDSITNEDQRTFIKVSVLLGTAPSVVAEQLATIVPQSYLTKSTVYRWYGDFKEGRRIDISDRPKSGRTRQTTTEENKEMVRQLILESEGMRTEDLIHETGLPRTSLMTILKEIGAKKLKSRWIPHDLTSRQKQSRHNIAGKHLASYQRESGFLDKIIAIDETWLKSYDPVDSRHSSEWLLPGQKAYVDKINFLMLYKNFKLTAFLKYYS